MATMKEQQEKIVKTLKSWKKLEERSATSAGEVAGRTTNPLIRQTMEIIRGDSERHAQVQQLIIDTFEKASPSLTPEELAEVWGQIEEHIDLERKMVASVRETLDAVKGKRMMVQEYFLHYLLTDEEKHDRMLAELEQVKRGMYPYGS